MYFKIGAPKTLAIFTGKHLWRSRFLIKMKAFRNATLLKRDYGKDFFLWISRIFKNNVFYRTSQVAASANIRIIGGVARTPPKKTSQIESFVAKPFTLHVYGGPDCTFAGVFNIKKLYSKYYQWNDLHSNPGQNNKLLFYNTTVNGCFCRYLWAKLYK